MSCAELRISLIDPSQTDRVTRLAKMTHSVSNESSSVDVKGGNTVDTFFNHCKKPNANDLDVLSRALREDNVKIESWSELDSSTQRLYH